MKEKLRHWFDSGAPWIWLNAGAVSISILMVVGLLLLIAVRGLGHFWPADLIQTDYRQSDGAIITVLGEIHDSEEIPREQLANADDWGVPAEADTVTRYLFKIGNRDIGGLDFRWLIADAMQTRDLPKQAVVLERREWGNFNGYFVNLKQDGKVLAEGEEGWQELRTQLLLNNDLAAKIRKIEKNDIGSINYELERLRLKQRGLELADRLDATALADIEASRAELNQQYQTLSVELEALYSDFQRISITMKTVDGALREIPLSKIVRAFQPNAMNPLQKTGHYLGKVWEFIADDPREANTEGGIFPAIFGTVVMVIIMSIIVTPFGVVAAVYLREYATQGPITRLIRIAVNNLAGVPSIVYGVFGLGFFVYFLGGSLDRLFYPEALPSPTFGTGGLMWASVTLALLTVPVVIVATEEGLSRIPKAIREGSLALGATKAETLWRTVLPMASPAMMTGLILAVARAAGEVAPLMLVGVVKLAPSLPVDGSTPFIHMDRKFMHLGFHIYDVGFQSPNVEAARPLVYATALLLVIVIILLNLAAIAIRNRLREKYRALEH